MTNWRAYVGVGALAAAGLLMGGCQNLDRSLIFFTNTTTGLEISSSGTSSDPVKIVMGYKRQEGVINPVFDNTEGGTGGPNQDARFRGEAYSVIAKYQGGADANAGNVKGGSTNGQWFATGEAAKTLAAQPGIAAAVTGSAAVGEVAAKQAEAVNKQNVSLETQADAVDKIVAKFKAGDDLRKLQIIKAATDAKLVPDGTDKTNFQPRIANSIDTANPKRTQELNDLLQSIK
jgi:hypothetical protein